MVANQLTARPFSFLLESFFSAADNLETCKKHREHSERPDSLSEVVLASRG